MAKQSYKIPDTLDKSLLDSEIALQSDGGVGVKPIPIKVVLCYIASALGCFWAVAQTFIGDGGPGLIFLFIVLWILLTFLLVRRDKTKQIQAQMIPTMLNYIHKANRYVITRNSANANAFYGVVGIKDINPDTGLISFQDDTVGYLYRVVGTGSILLFDEDRNAILNRVDSFYRKMKHDYELIFMTTKESQKVYRQVSNLKRRYDALDIDDEDLKALADMEYDCLRNHVGVEYRSIHQYMLLKADNKEALTVGKNMLQSEVENSSLMIKQCTALFGDDLLDVLRSIYRGKESV